ncbi:MAG: type II CRISPR-associated endonuclease Cas1 [Clostridia bacterium]|nr:type II CRISPR-associated endonuclease Cas1 [Clostridia bacterium]
MSWRTVIIEGRCKLDYRMGYMVVRSAEVKRVFLEEIAVLVIENPAVSLTGCLLEELTNRKIRVVFCDARRNPVAELTPHHGCHDSSARIKAQMQWSDGAKAAVWQRIVRDKIGKQARLLRKLDRPRECALLEGYVDQVQPLDATNREGHAAKVYFNALFGMEFTRSADCPVNSALNYGYSVLLSAMNREICALGCLTQLGIFHDNRFNHFNLGCDLMEPFRVLIDGRVVQSRPEKLERDEKRALWSVLNDTVQINGTRQTVLNAMRIYARSAIDALNREAPDDILFYREL